MSAKTSPVFSHEMFSLDTLDNWSLFNVLKQTKEVGYTGPPSEPIAAYRRALLWTMSHNQPDENERISAIYLKAEEAYIALDVCISYPILSYPIVSVSTCIHISDAMNCF